MSPIDRRSLLTGSAMSRASLVGDAAGLGRLMKLDRLSQLAPDRLSQLAPDDLAFIERALPALKID